MLTLSSPLSSFFCRRPAPVVVDDAPPVVAAPPRERLILEPQHPLAEAEVRAWQLWQAKQEVMENIGNRPAVRPPYLSPDEEWSPPDTHVLLFELAGISWEPKSPATIPWTTSTFTMPRDPANTIAIALNEREMQDNHRHSCWHVLIRPFHRGGFCVLKIVTPLDWRPSSPKDFPPGVTPRSTANVPAMQEAKAFNRKMIAMIDPENPARGVPAWAVPAKPLRL